MILYNKELWLVCQSMICFIKENVTQDFFSEQTKWQNFSVKKNTKEYCQMPMHHLRIRGSWEHECSQGHTLGSTQEERKIYMYLACCVKYSDTEYI